MNRYPQVIWKPNELLNPHAVADKARRVRAMFTAIADRYDLLNHLLSFNLDRRWRRRLVELSRVKSHQRVLDLCCGTGDMALEFAQAYPNLDQIIGVDFTEPMVAIARQKSEILYKQERLSAKAHPHWVCADSLQSCFAKETFHCISCAFGLRNLADMETGLRQMFHLLKPGGRLVILEFTWPDRGFPGLCYLVYFRLVLPWLASIISGDRTGAYHYLPQSVRSFAKHQQLDEILKKVGFLPVATEKLTFGTVLALAAEKQ